ncbi:MAG: hypothetical protein M3O67_04530 [Bacteroidota bacterium]|nr:hypothetical protein [Bacteroidota bacterium]
MEQQLKQIRGQQKETWNKFSPGLRKWDKLTMKFLKPKGDEIIRLLKPKDDDLVLDVAAARGDKQSLTLTLPDRHSRPTRTTNKKWRPATTLKTGRFRKAK